MKKHFTGYLSIIFLALIASMAQAGNEAEKSPVATMARILMDLNHYPTDKEKEKLQMIANSADNSAATRTIAMAIHNMEHSVTDADKAKLQALVAGNAASSEEKELADILLGITHYPGDKDRERLKSLKKQGNM